MLLLQQECLAAQNSDFAQLKSRSATVVVAANNSRNKEAADFIVPENNEGADTIITAALNTCPTGGRVLLLEGIYSCSSSIYLKSSKTLEGQGRGTILQLSEKYSSAHETFIVGYYQEEGIIKNLVLNGNNVLNKNGNKVINGLGNSTGGNNESHFIENLIIQNFTGHGICNTSLGSGNGRYTIKNCRIINNGYSGIHLQGGNGANEKIITHNFISGNGKSGNDYANVMIESLGGTASYLSDHVIISGNIIVSGGTAKWGIRCRISNSVITDNILNGAGTEANLSILNQTNCLVSNNVGVA